MQASCVKLTHMPNLKSVYDRAETHIRMYTLVLFGGFALLILLQAFFSPLTVATAVIALCLAIAAILRPWQAIVGLALYLPFESVILKFVPTDAYVFARYASEGLIYILAAVCLYRLLTKRAILPSTPLGLPIALFVIVLVSSAIINAVSPSVAILGLRQILRFVLVFLIALVLKPSTGQIKTLTLAILGVLGFESVLGLVQSVLGERLDLLLLPSEARTFGEITLTSGVAQFWEPGSRIFATFGRYDRLGNFLAFFLPMIVAGLYEPILRSKYRWGIGTLVVGVLALTLTFSRASWFAFAIAALYVGIRRYHDRRLLMGAAGFILVAVLYAGISSLSVSQITELPGQSLIERFYETFSAARWRGEYYGIGRVYWLIQTPLTVVPAAPLFGFGPGQFGAGAAAALHQTRVYDELGLPFGVFGSEGVIDNNWFSLWGEAGTIGFAFFLWAYVALFRSASHLAREHKDAFMRAMSGGYAGALLGVALIALLSTAFEIRTLAFYLWLYGGLVLSQSAYAHYSSK